MSIKKIQRRSGRVKKINLKCLKIPKEEEEYILSLRDRHPSLPFIF